MAVDYDGVHATVIRPRWHAVPDEDQHAARFPRRRGQLRPDAPETHALYDTFTYQPGHVDVFREVYEASPHSPPRKGERLLIVDIGAGAATVAAAVAEALGSSKRARINYRAFEPSRAMRRLGKRVLRHLDAGFNSAKYAKSLEDIAYDDAQRLLFAFSYVSHQDAVNSTHVGQWAAEIERATSIVEDVELIYTTTDRAGGVLPQLGTMLENLGIKRDRTAVPVEVHRRWPRLGSTAQDVRWDNLSTTWDVKAEHWKLTL